MRSTRTVASFVRRDGIPSRGGQRTVGSERDLVEKTAVKSPSWATSAIPQPILSRRSPNVAMRSRSDEEAPPRAARKLQRDELAARIAGPEPAVTSEHGARVSSSGSLATSASSSSTTAAAGGVCTRGRGASLCTAFSSESGPPRERRASMTWSRRADAGSASRSGIRARRRATRQSHRRGRTSPPSAPVRRDGRDFKKTSPVAMRGSADVRPAPRSGRRPP